MSPERVARLNETYGRRDGVLCVEPGCTNERQVNQGSFRARCTKHQKQHLRRKHGLPVNPRRERPA